MADENTAPEETQDQSVEAPSQEDQAQQEKPETFSENFDPASLPDELRPAYKQLQADYTRKTQSLSERRKEQDREAAIQLLRDPEAQAELLQEAGLYYADQEQAEEEFQDPAQDYEQRLAALEEYELAKVQLEQQTQAQEQEFVYIDNQISELEQSTGRKFTDDEANTIGTLATALRNEQGAPDVRQAYERIYASLLPEERKRWVQTKKAAQYAPDGVAGDQKLNMRDDKARVRAAAAIMEAESEESP